MNLTTLGIDLAKTSFSLVGMDDHGKAILRKTLKQDALIAFVAQSVNCLRNESLLLCALLSERISKPGSLCSCYKRCVFCCAFVGYFCAAGVSNANFFPFIASRFLIIDLLLGAGFSSNWSNPQLLEWLNSVPHCFNYLIVRTGSFQQHSRSFSKR
jgi:hypothetical protein